jgi:hypothetical protein
MPSVSGYFGPISMDHRPNLWGPLLKIELHSYPSQPQEATRLLKSPIVALIDTGAQLCTLDVDLADELGLKQGAGASFRQLGHEVPSPSFLATLYIPDVGYRYHADLMGSPFRRGDVPFQVILGWDLLRQFDLTLSRKADLVRLDFARQCRAA